MCSYQVLNEHMIIHVKNICHINMHVESQEEPCNVQVLKNLFPTHS